MPKVSVIIPAYNAEKYITETMDSVLKQTFQDFEVLVVDDGSGDKTADIVKHYADRFPDKVKYLFQANQGPGAARNRAIQESQGKYLAFIDADDIWLPNRLEEGVRVLEEQPQVGLVHGHTVRIDSAGNTIERPARNPRKLSGWLFEKLLTRKVNISCLTVLIRRKCIEKVGMFDESLQCIGVEDRDLWLRIAQEYPIVFINKIIGYYRIHATGISRDDEKILKKKIYVIDKFFPQKELSDDLRNIAMANLFKEHGDCQFIQRDFAKSRTYYLESLKYQPFSLRIYLNLMRIGLNHS